jgi:hypothetical protein
MLGLVAAVVLSAPACWDIYDQALRHRAASSQPSYVEYTQRTVLSADGGEVERADASMSWRSDGLTRVRDDRFPGFTFVTDRPDPGPPQLGPYGMSRLSWLPIESDVPLVGQVRAHDAKSCTNVGVETYRGHRVYHLVLEPNDDSRPSVKELWIDTESADIWKVIVSGYLTVVDADEPRRPLVDFAIELSAQGPYVMIDHITWSYRLRVYSQYSELFGEYYLGGYSYPSKMDSRVFDSRIH